MRTSYAAAPGSFPRFFKAVTGGADLTWRQYLLPLRKAELPQAYPCAMALAVLGPLLGSGGHILAGLGWLGLIPRVHFSVILAADAVLCIVLVVAWLARKYRALARLAKS